MSKRTQPLVGNLRAQSDAAVSHIAEMMAAFKSPPHGNGCRGAQIHDEAVLDPFCAECRREINRLKTLLFNAHYGKTGEPVTTHCVDCQNDACPQCARARRYHVLHERICALHAQACAPAVIATLDWDSFERRFERCFQDEFSSRGVPATVVQQIDWMDRALKAESKLAALRTLLKSFEEPTP